MGQALTGRKVKDSYKDVLQFGNDGSGVEATLQTLSDGNGTDTPLRMSTTGFKTTGFFSGPSEIDVQEKGAVYDATIDVGDGTVTGTDSTAALQAALAALPPPVIQAGKYIGGGGTVFVRGKIRITSPVTIANPYVRILGTGGHAHPSEWIMDSCIIFDPPTDTGTAFTVNAQGVEFEKVGIYTKRATSPGEIFALKVPAGYGVVTLRDCRIHGIDGVVYGPAVLDGTGVMTESGTSFFKLENSYVTGYNYGCDFRGASTCHVHHTQVIYNRTGMRWGSTGGVEGLVDGESVVQNNLVTNVHIVSCARLTFFGCYFENGEDALGAPSPSCFLIGDDAAFVPKAILIEACYLNAQADVTVPVVDLYRVAGLTIRNNWIGAATLVLTNNAVSVSDVNIYENLHDGGVQKAVTNGVFTGVVRSDIDTYLFYAPTVAAQTTSRTFLTEQITTSFTAAAGPQTVARTSTLQITGADNNNAVATALQGYCYHVSSTANLLEMRGLHGYCQCNASSSAGPSLGIGTYGLAEVSGSGGAAELRGVMGKATGLGQINVGGYFTALGGNISDTAVVAQAGEDACVGVVAKGFSGTQSGDLFQAQTSAGVVKWRMKPGGIPAHTPISTSVISTNPNDYALPAGKCVRIVTDNIGEWTFSGFVAGADGEERVLINVGTTNVFLAHQDGASAAANRIICDTGAFITLAQYQRAFLTYDATLARWVASKL